jgi:microcystin-dependent protein
LARKKLYNQYNEVCIFTNAENRKYKEVTDNDGINYNDLDFPGGVVEGTIQAWKLPNGRQMNEFFISTVGLNQGLGIGKMKGKALCNGLNGTPDLRGLYLPMTTNCFLLGGLSPQVSGQPANAEDTQGQNTVTLTETQLPVIDMSKNTPNGKFHWEDLGHFHEIIHDQDNAGSSGPGFWTNTITGSGTGEYAATEQEVTGITVSIDNIGGGSAHENRPASYYVYYIMQIK